jgi:transposase
MGYWAKAPMAREQLVLIATTLDDRIPDDHPVRLIAEIIEGYDWSVWESQYDGRLGQPPIHPKILASLWLYGLRRGVRSSRKLEYTAKHSIDFMWLAQGHTPDHTTLSEFRSKHSAGLKDLFRHILRVAMVGGFLDLIDVGTDGTRIKANSSRYETWTAERIAKALEELAAELEKQLAESRQTDERERPLLGDSPAEQLPAELADLTARRKKLEAIQAQVARGGRSSQERRNRFQEEPGANP